MVSQETLDRLVCQYLEKRKLVAASAALRAAAPASFGNAPPNAPAAPVPPPLPPTTADGGAAFAGDLLTYLDADGDPARLAEEFDALAAWCDRSLDAFRPELSRVLYPVFVHAYLDLVAKGQASAASGMLSRHKARFGGVGGGRGGGGDKGRRGDGDDGDGNDNDDDEEEEEKDDEDEATMGRRTSVRSRARRAELAALAAITAPEQVAADRAVAAARSTRYPVALCEASFELLAGFLRSRSASLLLCLVNDRIALRVRPGQPTYKRGIASAARRRRARRMMERRMRQQRRQRQRGGDDDDDEDEDDEDLDDEEEEEDEDDEEEELPALLAGADAAGDARETNATPLRLGLLPDQAEDLRAEELASVGDAIPDFDADGKPLTKKARAALLRAAEREKLRREKAKAARVPADIPLPEPDPAEVAAALDDLRCRVPVSGIVGGGMLPSAAFFTFANTSRGLTSVDLSRDGRIVAGGFVDGSVRLYDTREMTTVDRGRGLGVVGGRRARRKRRRTRAEVAAAAAAAADGEKDGDDEEEGNDLPEEDDDDDYYDDDEYFGPVTLRGHSGAVYSVSLGGGGGTVASSAAADGSGIENDDSANADADVTRARLVFSGGADGTVRAWSTEAAAPLAAYRGHLWPVWSVAACPRPPYFASGGADRVARVWSTERGSAPLRLLAGHAADVTVVAWHPNCHSVATGSDDGTVRLWDVRDGSVSRVLVGGSGSGVAGSGGSGGAGSGGSSGGSAPITALAFSNDGRSLASGDEDGGVCVWDLAAAARRARLGPGRAHRGAVWSLSWSYATTGAGGGSGSGGEKGGGGEGNVLASGGADDALRLWDCCAPSSSSSYPLASSTGAGASGGGGGGGGGGSKSGGSNANNGANPSTTPASVPRLAKLADFRTKATPVFCVRFTTRNLLLGAGPLTLGRG